MGLGLVSAGVGQVPAKQTYLDVSQGNRIDPALYDGPPVGDWAQLRARAEEAPADLVPGLLGSTLKRAGVAVQATRDAGEAELIGVSEGGEIREASPRCARICQGLTVARLDVPALSSLAAELHGSDLLIAFAAPPPRPEHELPIGIAGRGFAGELRSDSTRIDGLVLSTDLAPTILERLGLPVPGAMDGQPITSGGSADAAALTELDDRMADIQERRWATIGFTAVAWAVLAGLAGVVFGARGLRRAWPLLACSIVFMPAVLLLTAAMTPSTAVEALMVGLGCPALALLAVRLGGAWGGLAIAAAVMVGGYANDVVAGSGLTSLSLIGPNPAHGARFYGVGNEVEAFAAALVPIGVGAGLTGWRPRLDGRSAALAFALAALVVAAAFAPGRFGADVGAAIDLAVGATVAALVCLRGDRRPLAWAWVLAAPLAALAVLALVDLVSGGGSHLTRSVLDAGGLDELGQVAERRLRLSANSFSTYATSPFMWAAIALVAAGIWQRRRIAAWFGDRRHAWAGFLGGAGGVAAAILANDSGGLVLMVGTALLTLAAGTAWATDES